MKIHGKKVLITGADGFIGSHLVEELVKIGAKVSAFVLYNAQNKNGNIDLLPKSVLNEIKVFSGNMLDSNAVKTAVKNQDLVFHLAALISIPYSYTAPESYVLTNVMGTLNLLQACRESNVQKVVHTSTSETYGTATKAPIDEKHYLQAQSPYAATKIAADKLAESFYYSFGLPVSTIRPFNTYGPRQSARAVIPTIISQVISGKKEIKLGALTPVRDMNYVKDTVSGYILMAESDDSIGKVINIGSGKGSSIGEIANMIIRIAGRDCTIVEDKIRIRPEKSEVKQMICDYSKAIKLLGYKPKYTLEEGLKETINFIRENIGLYKPDEYTV